MRQKSPIRTGIQLAIAVAFSGVCLKVMSQKRPVSLAPVPPAVVKQEPGPLLFQLKGTRAEFGPGKDGNHSVTPTVAPPDLTGKVVVTGAGSMSFADADGGLVFEKGGQQRSDSAFVQFTGGPAVFKLFNLNGRGSARFKWRSRYSLAERKQLQASSRFIYRTAVDVYNDSGEQFVVQDYIQDGLLCLVFKMGDARGDYYFFPKGQEDAMFGKNVVLDLEFQWDGRGKGALYLNGALAMPFNYVPPGGMWTDASFSIGARDRHEFGGGFYASDDVITDFEVRNSPAPRDVIPPVVSLLAPLDGQTVSGIFPVRANATDNDGIASLHLAIDDKEVASSTVYPYSFFWDSHTAGDGKHRLRVIAVDKSGNNADAAAVLDVQNAAAAARDVTPPGAPVNFRTLKISDRAVSFQWNPAADNVGVTKYVLTRNGVAVGAAAADGVKPVTFSDSGLTPGESYSYEVTPVDKAGNSGAVGSPWVLVTKKEPGRTLTVGPKGKYKKPCAAFAEARPWDTVEIEPSEDNYLADVCVFKVDHLTVRGVNGRPRIVAGGATAQNKAIWVVAGAANLIENVDISGGISTDGNGAAIRLEGVDLTLRGVYFHHNQDGILAGSGIGGKVLIEYSEFFGSGAGDGRSHAIYMGDVDRFTMRYSYSHHCDAGHLVKSRAKENYIFYNRLTDEDGAASYEIDLSNGGFTEIVGNLLEKTANSTNGHFISYAMEGFHPGGSKELYIVNNTFVSHAKQSWAFHAPDDATGVMQNNIFSGNPITVYPGGMVRQVSNKTLPTTAFRDAAHWDYRPKPAAAAPAAGARAPVDAKGQSLAPAFEYLQDTSGRRRDPGSAIDLGAFQAAK
jgi:hypothetical protein